MQLYLYTDVSIFKGKTTQTYVTKLNASLSLTLWAPISPSIQTHQLHPFINTELINRENIESYSFLFSHSRQANREFMRNKTQSPSAPLKDKNHLFFLTVGVCVPIRKVSNSDYIARCLLQSKPECFPVTIHPCLQYAQRTCSYNCFYVSACN